MNVTVKREDLLRELSVVQQAASRKQTIPIISNVLVTAVDGRLRLAATDFDIWILTDCACQVDEAGSTTVSAEKFLSMVSQLTSDCDIRLATEGAMVRLDAAGFKAKLQSLPVSEFPQAPDMPPAWESLSRDSVRSMLARTRGAAATDDSKYFLNGVKLEAQDGALSMAATDGKRLVTATAPLPEQSKSVTCDMMLPRRCSEVLYQALDTDVDSLEFSDQENHIFFRVGHRVLVSRKIDGKFPQWRRVMPKDGRPLKAQVGREALVGALKRVRLANDTKSTGVRLTLGMGRLCLAASSVSVGDAEEVLDVAYDGPEVTVVVQCAYALGCVEPMQSDEVSLQVQDAVTSVLLRESGAEGFEANGLIQPLVIKDGKES